MAKDTSTAMSGVTFTPWGRNLSYAIVGDAMYFRTPLSQDAVNGSQPSASGKNRTIATSGGLIAVPGAPFGAKVNLTVSVPIQTPQA